ncbi:proline-rich protein 29 [Chiroxiphia lanceolata]|uniref:proline-rich protein 29 n=1 Tax=Chiroxiphia lanceolata TaxID=296741 RepID=UPI0013CED536|nr:proline-rich protein 29 [Chiroxiphia lanceolata]
MERGAAGDPHGARGDPPAGTYFIPQSLRSLRCPQGAVPVSQQPVMILQQLPGPGAVLAPPAGPPPVRGDLIELMMIQNSQMHQVLMNSLAVSALTSFGFGPSPATAQALAMPLQTEEEEEEEEAVVFHHHYIPYPGPVPILPWLDPERDRGPGAVRFLGSLAEDEVSVVPPPPPPSATGTVGPNVPPASEYYSVLEERL